MRQAHYVAPLVRSGVPDRHVIFDTEASSSSRNGAEVQTFALAVAEYVDVRGGLEDPPVRRRDYSDPAALWQDVAAFTRPRRRTVCWAHNLAYDLRVSRALAELPRLGFALSGIVLEHTASWASFRGPRGTVLCCDLHSWLPAPLASIARDLGTEQQAIQHRTAGAQQLLERCRGDVEVTRQAVLELLRLLQREDMGPWRATAAGQSHAAWRKRWLSARPLVHDDADALAAERRAIWTGRCEVWRWGKSEPGGVHEYDLELAYPRIAAERRLPHAIVGRTGELTPATLNRALERYAVLAEVDVSTPAPVVPMEQGGRIVWPVGRFSSTLWSPELQLLIDAGAELVVRRAWLYDRSPALQPFARWLLAQVAASGTSPTALQRRALKHMSRTLIGRFALRYRGWQSFCELPDFGLRLGLDHDLRTGVTTETLHVGHELLHLGAMTESDESLPQITGYVASEARARLWQLVQLAGESEVLYMDTDALLVTPAGARALELAIDEGRAYSLRHKASYRQATIHGPRQLVLGKQRRIAGVPKSAREVSPGVYAGETWRSLRESVVRGESDSVVVEPGTWHLAAVDPRRLHLEGGLTAPHAVG